MGKSLIFSNDKKPIIIFWTFIGLTVIAVFQNCSPAEFDSVPVNADISSQTPTNNNDPGNGNGSGFVQSASTTTTAPSGSPTTTITQPPPPPVVNKGTAFSVCHMGMISGAASSNISIPEMGNFIGLTGTNQQLYTGSVNINRFESNTNLSHVHSYATQSIGTFANNQLNGHFSSYLKLPANTDFNTWLPTGTIGSYTDSQVSQSYICGYNLGVISNITHPTGGGTQFYIFGNIGRFENINNTQLYLDGNVTNINNVTATSMYIYGNIQNISNTSANITIYGGRVNGTVSMFTGTIRTCNIAGNICMEYTSN
jgi:hypothetical protein